MSETKVNGVVQIGILVRNADEAVRQYSKLLGISDWNINFVDTDRDKGRNFRAGEDDVAVKAKIAWTTIGARVSDDAARQSGAARTWPTPAAFSPSGATPRPSRS